MRYEDTGAGPPKQGGSWSRESLHERKDQWGESNGGAPNADVTSVLVAFNETMWNLWSQWVNLWRP